MTRRDASHPQSQADAGENERVVALTDAMQTAAVDATGANGLPVATIARPSDQRTACSAVHSLLLVGFESGNTIGRAWIAAIDRTTPSVNAPGVPDVPTRIVGLKLRTASSSVTRRGSPQT